MIKRWMPRSNLVVQFRVLKMAPKSAEQAGLKTPLISKVEATAVNPAAETAAKKAVPFTALYRYASYLDVVAMVIALISSLINGAAFPLLGILFGNLLNALQGAHGLCAPGCFPSRRWLSPLLRLRFCHGNQQICTLFSLPRDRLRHHVCAGDGAPCRRRCSPGVNDQVKV